MIFVFKIIAIFGTVIYFLLYFLLAARTLKPLKTIFSFAVIGLIGMIAINLTAKFTGVYIPVNYYSVGSCCALGLPGTIGLLILKMIM